MNIAAVRDGLKANLATVSGLRAHDVWPDTVNPPAALVTYTGPEFLRRSTLARTWEAYFDVQMIVSMAGGLDNAQHLMDAYLVTEGVGSVIAAIESDDTLDGAAEYVLVQYVTEPLVVQVAEVAYLGTTLRVQVVG